MVSGPSGIPTPAAFIAILISSATPMPARTPTAEATTARMAASTRTKNGHLRPGCSNSPQQGQFSNPLSHRDPESVLDHEGTNEDSDPGESQQGCAQKAEALRHLVELLLSLLLSGHDFCGAGQYDRYLGDESVAVDSVNGEHIDSRKSSLEVEEHLSLFKFERRNSRSGEVVLASEVGQADDGESVDATDRLNVDFVIADGETL